MATVLMPAINTLGIAAPYIGPWFDPDIQLAAPDVSMNADLSVTLQFAQNTNWLPPATGLFGLHVSTTPRPKSLAKFRDPSGADAFDPNRLIALFTLLPEVEDRLNALVSSVAPADGGAAGNNPTRARVRHLALQMPDTNFTWLQRIVPVPPADVTTNADIAAYFGVVLDPNGTTVSNDPHPMNDMRTPGKLPLIGNFEPIMMFLQADQNIRMFAFDDRGRALDPGAVAAWWAAIGANFAGMWAPGLSNNAPTEQRTCGVANARSVHIVSAHEGTLDSSLQGRLNVTGVGSGVVPLFLSDGQAVNVAFQSAPTPDNAPVPRAGALPSGRYVNNLQLWANNPLARDFVRVAVVDVEEHLVGTKRIAPQNPTTEQSKRALDQERTTTRVNIARSAAPALLPTVDTAAAAALGVIAGNNTQVVAGVLDPDWGPLTGLAAGAAPQYPGLLPAMVLPVAPLAGGNANPNALPKLGQRVLIRFTGLGALANCWLRAWPVGFDLKNGEHIAMTGGAGLIDVGGNVSLVMELPDGAGTGQLGVRFAVTGPDGSTREYTEQRFGRPVKSAAAAPERRGMVQVRTTSSCVSRRRTSPWRRRTPPSFPARRWWKRCRGTPSLSLTETRSLSPAIPRPPRGRLWRQATPSS